MTSPSVDDATSLGRRLKELRESRTMTQRAVADALGGERPLSPALISSWEGGKALPSQQWLARYARIFERPQGGPGEPVSAEELEAELTALRVAGQQRAARLGQPEPDDGLGSFWRFPDGWPVRIVGTPMFDRVLAQLAYSNSWHPNYIESLHNADMDATVELFGHIRAANPTSDVRFLTQDDLQRDDLTSHLVLLGGADTSLAGRSSLGWLIRRLNLPVSTRLPEGGDEEYDAEFVVATDVNGKPAYRGAGAEEVYRPTFLVDHDDPAESRVLVEGYPQLEYDLGLLVRQPNPMNLQATVTVCSGIFSRGTYGVVRVSTDARLRDVNEQYLGGRLTASRFWLLMRVPVFPGPHGAETITPDLSREFHIVRQSEQGPR